MANALFGKIARYFTSPPTLQDGEATSLLTDANGFLLTAGSGPSGAVSIVGSAADNSTNSTTKLPTIVARANAAAPSWTEGRQVPQSVDLSGNTRVIQETLPSWGNPTEKYQIANTDETDPNYYGYQAADGSWYIMRQTITGSTAVFEYTKGAASYSTAWTGRAGLTYTDFATAF